MSQTGTTDTHGANSTWQSSTRNSRTGPFAPGMPVPADVPAHARTW
jgi:hypothetical protein